MKLLKKIFNKLLFAVILAVVFSLINRCEVKAYQVSQRSGVPYVYTNGTSASSISSIYEDLSSNAIGGFDYGCDNTFSSYNVINNLYSSSSGLCNYVLQSKTNLNEFYFGLNPMSSYDSNEPLPVFLKIEKPSGYDMMAVSSGSGISVVLFPSSSQPILGTESSSPYSGKITAVADNTFYFNITISSKTQYNPSKYYITSYMLNNTQYLYSTNQGGLSNLYYSPNSTNRTFLYFGTTSLTWPSSNDGDIEQDSSLVPPINYDIDFVTINSSDNSQENYGNDITITSVGVAIKYSPCDNTLYNYYYSFVPQGSTDMSEFTQVNNNTCIGSYNATQNGTIIGIIKDKEDNLLYSVSFNIRNIGTTSTFAVNNNKFSTFLTDLSSNINYGGPISGLTTIPINFMSTLYNSFNGTCTAYNLGSLLGHNIVINCFSLQSILGSSITGVIDMICAFGIYYHLVLLIISIYRKVMNLEELDDYLPQHMYHPKHGSYEDLNG